MKIKDIVASGKPSISFEVFPPKRDMPLEPVRDAVRELAAAKPAFISVTYGAAGGTSCANTAAIAAFVGKECRVTALAHLTCVAASRESLAAEVAALSAAGIENVLALRGDVPPGLTFPGDGDFRHACDLVRFLRTTHPELCLGGACYPEGHPESMHLKDDIAHVKEKVDAGLDFLTTQMFFDNNILYAYLAKIRSAGIRVPVVAGIMPVTNARQISRICKLSGTLLPPRFRAIVDRFGDNPDAMLEAGVAHATEQIVDLFANGVDNVHVYTMNKPAVANRIMANLRSILG
ncbi:MAG: methylenetetrahydrofolate reductase [Kiritimatiellia bacterium]